MSQVLDETRRSHAAQRGVSQGASITLCATSAGYQARFDCAIRAAEILGTRHLTDYATPPESVPTLTIPLDETYRAIGKLAERFSVALVDTVTDDHGTRFVLVWKIDVRAPVLAVAADVNAADLVPLTVLPPDTTDNQGDPGENLDDNQGDPGENLDDNQGDPGENLDDY